MTTQPHHQTAFWLIVSAVLLSSLVPGGPIENRDFSHIHPGILGAFNIFLTTLNLGSFVFAYFAFKRRPWALQGAFIAAVSYFAVYAVDLAQLFPRSPTPMSFALAFIEVLGMTAAVPLMFASRRFLDVTQESEPTGGSRTVRYAITAVLVVAGVAIIWFATDAAMTGGSASVSLTAQVAQ